MKKETKSLDEIVIESESVVQPAEPKPKKRIGLGIMLVVLALLTVGGALATGYLWGNNSPKAVSDVQTNKPANNENTSQAEPEEEQKDSPEDVSNTQDQGTTSVALDKDYFYISDWGVKIKTPGGAFSYATDGQYRVFVWGHKYIQGEQAVPAHGSIGFWDDTIANPVYLGMIQVRHCAYEDCNSAIFRSKDGSIGLTYQESTTAAEKYSSSEKQNPSLDPNYAMMVTTDIEMLKEHFTNPNNYVEVK